MLVLLIIFMVAAPLTTFDLPVDLPSSSTIRTPRPDNPVYITINTELELAVNEMPVARGDLVSSLDAIFDAAQDRRIFLRADRAVSYGELMSVLELLRLGGFQKVSLVALEKIPETAPSLRPADGP